MLLAHFTANTESVTLTALEWKGDAFLGEDRVAVSATAAPVLANSTGSVRLAEANDPFIKQPLKLWKIQLGLTLPEFRSPLKTHL